MGLLDGKVAIVTGAARGIGFGVAVRFAKEGAAVVVASRGQPGIDAAVANIEALGAPVLGLVVDVGDRNQVDAMVDRAVARFGGLDILVNNAQSWGSPSRRDAFPPPAPVHEIVEEDWDFVFQTGLKGTLYGMQAAFAPMSERGSGSIINFGSCAAMQSWPGMAAYNANKEAIRSLTRTAARDWGGHRITVNCICPKIATDSFWRRLEASADPVERGRLAEIGLQSIPIGRYGEAERDAGGLAVYLASDSASFITGQTFVLDGGATIGTSPA